MLVRAERHRWIDGSMAQPLAVFFIFSKVQESGYSWATRISRFWVIRSGQCTSGPLFDARHTQKKNVNGAGTTFFSLVCSGHVADEGKVSPKAQIFSWILSLFFDESAVKCSPMTFFNWNSLHQWNVSSENRRSISFEYLRRFACKTCCAERSIWWNWCGIERVLLAFSA